MDYPLSPGSLYMMIVMYLGNMARISKNSPILIAKFAKFSFSSGDITMMRKLLFKTSSKFLFMGFALGFFHSAIYYDLTPAWHLSEWNRTFIANYSTLQLGILLMSTGPRMPLAWIISFCFTEHHMLLYNRRLSDEYRHLENGIGINIGDFTPQERRLLE